MKKDLVWLVVGILFAVLYTCGVAYLGYREGHAGVVALQNKITAQAAADKFAAQKVQLENEVKTTNLQKQLDEANSLYEQSIQQPAVSVASSIAAGVADRTIRLRVPDQTCPASSAGSNITASARAADAAATQALADRVRYSIAAVRAGDAADKRESELDAQIIGLQTVLRAERAAGQVNETLNVNH